MGIRIDNGAKRVTISGVTSRKMWGDGFYVEGAKDTKFCGVIADNNRRQGLSIVEADGVLVTDSVFRNTRGTRPSAGIDLEPDHAEQKIVNVRIQNSKFIDNAGPGIEIAGKRGAVAKVELARNMFRGNRPDPRRECSSGACLGDLRQSSGQLANGAAGRSLRLRRHGRCRRPPERLRGGQRHALRGEPEYAQEEKVSLIPLSRRAGRRRRLEHSALPSRALRVPRRRSRQSRDMAARAAQPVPLPRSARSPHR